MLPAMVDALHEFAQSTDSRDRERRKDSVGLLTVIDTAWVFTVCMMEEILERCKALHLQLQSPELDIPQAMVLVRSTQGEFIEKVGAIDTDGPGDSEWWQTVWSRI